jgi:hypothetical protein
VSECAGPAEIVADGAKAGVALPEPRPIGDGSRWSKGRGGAAPVHRERSPAATLEGVFHEGLATSAYFRRALYKRLHPRPGRVVPLFGQFCTRIDLSTMQGQVTCTSPGPEPADGGQDRAHALGWGETFPPSDLRPSPATPLYHRKLQMFQKEDNAHVRLYDASPRSYGLGTPTVLDRGYP